MTSFIGREREMREVKRRLATTPLLTLVGSGGCGKTRLAVQVGADVLDNYQDGVWLVELAALSEPDLVPQAVANVLGLREEAGRSLLQSLQEHLRDRKLLLLLDNCEHLLDACARLADTLLKSCPQLTIMASSRAPLGIAGEHLWRVPSLLTPEPDDLPGKEKDLAAILMEYDACRLFVERAVAQRQGDYASCRAYLEGRWEEILAHNAAQLAGRKVKIYIEAEEDLDTLASFPNEKALAALRQIERMQAGMRDTDGSQTDRIIREGRDGGMYRDDATK